MRLDIRATYMEVLEGSHLGYPSVVSTAQSRNRGRPRIIFDPNFLAWAYNRRSISALARFLGVGRTTLRNALIEHGIMVLPEVSSHPNQAENISNQSPSFGDAVLSFTSEAVVPEDIVLEPDIPLPNQLPQDVQETAAYLPSSQRPPGAHTHYHHSTISDADLDNLITRLRLHFRRAGIRMINGMLLRLGHRVQQARIRESLLRIDPVRRVFERIRIRRRKYSVAGPNALWHHDGQHG